MQFLLYLLLSVLNKAIRCCDNFNRMFFSRKQVVLVIYVLNMGFKINRNILF